ncbi:tetratricopeptide repeat protein [Saccharopolyspora griseoalba]|uniref:Tetratricopeptide repeat protein n=1 Tax=Saccharopolyspora griseoalba TaxID=1431848 RepID=A0ABW2LLC8_9PSEU
MSRWEKRITQARQLLLDGDQDGAERELRTVLREGDLAAAAQAGLQVAAMLAERDELTEAREIYQRVVDTEQPAHAQSAAIALGNLLLEAEELASAQVLLRMAAEGPEPDEAGRAEVLLAQVLTERGDGAGAREARGRALASGDPGVVEAAQQLSLPPDRSEGAEYLQIAYQRALAMLEQGRDGDAEPILHKLLDSGHPHYGSLGAAKLYALHADEAATARELADRIIALAHPEHLAWGHVLRGGVLEDLDEPAGAAEAYELAAQDPRPKVRLHALIRLSIQLRRTQPQRAREVLQQVIDTRHPDYAVEALGVLAELQRDAGDPAAAIETFGRVVDSGHPDKAPLAAYHLGVLRYDQDDLDGAAEAFRRAARATDANLAHQAELALSMMDPERASATDTALLAAVPDEPELDAGELLDRARKAAAAADLATARDDHLRLLGGELAAQARISLGLAEAALGDRQRGRQLLREAAGADGSAQARYAAFLDAVLDEPSAPAVLPVLLRVEAGEPAADPHELVAVGAAAFTGRAPTEELVGLTESVDSLVRTTAGALLAEQRVRSERSAEAQPLLQRVLDEGHPAPRPWAAIALGELLMERGELDGTVAAFETALATRHPAIVGDAFDKLALIYRTLERHDELRDLYRRTASAGHPEHGPRAAFLLGEELVDADDLDAALELFTRAAGSNSTTAAVAVFGMRAVRQELEAAQESFLALAEDSEQRRTAAQLCLKLAHRYLGRGVPSSARWALRLVGESGPAELRQQGWLFLGALHVERGEHEAALRAWEQAVEGIDPEEAVVAKVSIADLVAETDPDRAVALLEEVASSDARNSADAARRLAELRPREVPSQRGADAEPPEGESDFERAERLLRSGHAEAAKAVIAGHYDSTLLAEFWHLVRTNLASATELLAEAGEEDRRICSELALELGRRQAAAGSPEALARFRLVVDHGHPEAIPKAHLALGKHAEKRGEHAMALSWYRRAIHADEPAAVARAGVLMSQLLARVHDLHGAISIARHSHVEGTGTAALEAGVLLGHLQHLAGEPEEARRTWDEAEQSADSAEQFGTALHRRIRVVGETAPEAEAMLRRAAESDDPATSAIALRLLADRAEDPQQAIGHLRAAAEADAPAHAEAARGRLAEILLEQGHSEAAGEQFERVRRSEEPSLAARGEFGLGLIRYESGDLPGAVVAFVKAAGHAPEEDLGEDALNNVRVVLDDQRGSGDHQGATDTLRRMTEVVPEDHVAEWAQEAGDELLGDGDPDAALVYLRCAVEIGAPDPVPDAVLALGEALQRRGDVSGARQAYQRVLGSGEERLAAVANHRLNELASGRSFA